MKKIIKKFIFIVMLILLNFNFLYCKEKNESILEEKIKNFKIKIKMFDLHFAMKELSKKSNINYLFIEQYSEEYAMVGEHKVKMFKGTIPSINFDNITIKEIINKLIEIDRNYIWEEKEGVIIIKPIGEKMNYAKKFLNTKIKKFNYRGGITGLIGELIKITNDKEWHCSYFDKFYERTYSLSGANEDLIKLLEKPAIVTINIENATVEDILIKSLKEDKNSNCYIDGYKINNKFMIDCDNKIYF